MCKAVSEAYEIDPPDEPSPEQRTLPGFGETLCLIAPRFAEEGALGLILVDGSPLSRLERVYGSEALQRSLHELGAIVCEAAKAHLRPSDLVVTGETGRNEILILLFRPYDDARFYVEEMPTLRRALAAALAGAGDRVVRPVLKETPPIHVGSAASLRNPTLSPTSQIRVALDEARVDAELESRIAGRERRRRFIEMLLQGEVYSVYEPIVEVTTKTVFGYEALARGPEGSPLHFPIAMFDIATEEDLIFQLDCLCRRKALEGALELPSGTKLFLNIRPTCIHDPNFRAESLSKTLEHSPFSPSDVVFEISEQESITNFDSFRDVRDYYRNLGFQIALDDMGAGYGSLEAVVELRPDYIKVDRTCVSKIDKDPARRVLLSALHTVAGKIGARIIAEGLDTLEELATLGDLGIPFGQGWLFGKPTPLLPKR